MNTTDQWIALAPEEYRLVADLVGGRAWWVPSVSRFMVEIAGSDQLTGEELAEDEVSTREIWTDSLLRVVQMIGGIPAEVIQEVPEGVIGEHGQMVMFG